MNRDLKIEKIDASYMDVKLLIHNGEFDEAIKIINKLHYNSLQINYTKGVNLYYEKLIIIQYYTVQNYLAISNLQYLIPIYLKDEKKNLLNLSRLYVVFGVILSRLCDYKNSSFYLDKALSIDLAIDASISKKASTYESLAFNKIMQKQYSEALLYIDKGLELFYGNEKSSPILYLQIAKIGVLIDTKEISEAKKLFKEALLNDYTSNKIGKNYLNAIQIQLELIEGVKNPKQFLELTHRSLKSALNVEKELTLDLLEFLIEFHKNNNEYKLALEYSLQIIEINKKESKKEVTIVNVNDKKRQKTFDKQELKDDEFEIYSFSDLEKAAQYQQGFYQNRINSSVIKVDTLFKPAKTLSGDYIGTFNIGNDDNLIVLADVVGKGITASYISFMLDGIIKSIISNADSFNLLNAVTDINKILSDSLRNQGFVSLWIGLIKTKERIVESVNAGHLPTFLLQGSEKKELTVGCTILGMFDILPDLKSEFFEFNENDSIIAYSDGVTEAIDENQNQFENNFLSLIDKYKQNKELNFIECLEKDIKKHRVSSLFNDDISCLLIEYKK